MPTGGAKVSLAPSRLVAKKATAKRCVQFARVATRNICKANSHNVDILRERGSSLQCAAYQIRLESCVKLTTLSTDALRIDYKFATIEMRRRYLFNKRFFY